MNKNIEKLLDFQYFVDPTVIPSKYVFSPTVQIQTSFSIFVWKKKCTNNLTVITILMIIINTSYFNSKVWAFKNC